ncbi:TetR/AcrR family transcriptional regulator [Actinomycetospora flava]|uniref:TetR/AcrR family transcriptional regulator n=1 Tax=Actinomycetospora flava TaxID=3129232 RepID=A0ABU8M2Y0_9PSEU
MSASRRRRAAPDAPDSDIARRRLERRQASGRRSDERWAEILAGAARVFQRLGYSPATLEDVAVEVGVNRATLYYYVGTKEELLVGLLYRPLETLRERVDEVAALPEPAPQRLESSLREYVRTMAELPELFVFLAENVHEVMSGPEADRIRDNADRSGRAFAEIIRSGVQEGGFRTDIDPAVAVLGIIGMFNWMHRWYRPDGARTLQDLGEDFIAMALSSVRPPPTGDGHGTPRP